MGGRRSRVSGGHGHQEAMGGRKSWVVGDHGR